MNWNPRDNWFNNEYKGSLELNQFCRTGRNSPNSDTRHFFTKFVNSGDTFLDIGFGGLADYDILKEEGKSVIYKGLDYAQAMVDNAKLKYPDVEVGLCDLNDKINEGDNSWDVVNCRHVVDHCEYYEKPLLELIRVARKRVIVTLWRGFTKHDGDNIRYNEPYGWTNDYGRTKFLNFLSQQPIKFHYFSEGLFTDPDIFMVLDKI